MSRPNLEERKDITDEIMRAVERYGHATARDAARGGRVTEASERARQTVSSPCAETHAQDRIMNTPRRHRTSSES